MPGEFGPFFQMAVISERVSKIWFRSVRLPYRLGVEKKIEERKIKPTAVKYKPFGIAFDSQSMHLNLKQTLPGYDGR